MAAKTPHYSDNPAAFPLEGGCACGHVRYRLEKAPLFVQCCHCTSCQREMGSAFVINALVESQHVTLLPPSPPFAPANPNSPDEFPACSPALAPPEQAQGVARLVVVAMPSQSGLGQEIMRCPSCFTIVWSHYGSTGPAMTFIRTSTLDRAWLIDPDVQIYVASKRHFFDIADGKPQFDGFYPSREALYRPESMDRYRKILPDINIYRRSKGLEERT